MRPLNQEQEQIAPEPPFASVNAENASDEANILADQDETIRDPQVASPNLGGEGTTEDFGLTGESDEFALGEIDVKEQMDRTTASANATLKRPRDPNATPFSPDGRVDS